MRPQHNALAALLLTLAPAAVLNAQVNSRESNALTFQVNDTEYARISDTSGNVGIGTTNPVAKLTVAGNVSVTGMVDVGHTAQACATAISGSIRFESVSDTLQICTSAGWKSLTSASTVGNATVASSTGAIQFNSGGQLAGDTSNLFWDDANNRLGIGTSSPAYNLHVSTSTAAANFIAASMAAAGYASSGVRNNVGKGLDLTIYGSTVAGTQFGLTNSNLTSIYSNGDNLLVGTGTAAPLVFGTNSNERMRISSGGNVGIGTIAPGSILDVVGSTDAVSISAAGASAQIRLSRTGTSAGSMSIGADVDGFSVMNASTYAKLLTVSGTTGNVGIGTTTPSRSFVIQGNSDGLRIETASGPTTYYSEIISNYLSTEPGYYQIGSQKVVGLKKLASISAETYLSNFYGLSFVTGVLDPTLATVRMFIAQDGKVGVGTTSATSTLQVSGTFTVSSTITNATPALFVNTSGNVGIGTTAPAGVLHASGSLAIMETGTNRKATFQTLPALTNVTDDTTYGPSIGFSRETDGINNIAGMGLYNANSLFFGAYSNIIFGSGAIGTFNNAHERMRIASNGDVGIGTTTPAAELDVTGNVSVTGMIDVGHTAQACATPISGSIRYETTSNTLQVCTGSGWKSLVSDTARPSFHVHKNNTNQTVTPNATTLLTWSTERFDTNNNFASNNFLPTVAGKYLITLTVSCAAVSGYCIASIYKNGGVVVRNVGTREPTAGAASTQVSTIIDMNGTTDYIEAYGSNQGGNTILGPSYDTYFSGAYLTP